MMTALLIIVLVLVICVGVLFRKVAKLQKPLSDKETWERNQALKNTIRDELKEVISIEVELQLIERLSAHPEEMAVEEGAEEEPIAFIVFELTKEIDEENVAVAAFIDDEANGCYSVFLNEGEELPADLEHQYPKAEWSMDTIISALGKKGWELVTKEEIAPPTEIQPLPFELSFKRVGEEEENEKCYFYDAGDSFIKTIEQIECIPENPEEYEEFPKSVWPKEHIVSIFTNEGWELNN